MRNLIKAGVAVAGETPVLAALNVALITGLGDVAASMMHLLSGGA